MPLVDERPAVPALEAAAPRRGALFAAALLIGPVLLVWNLHALWNPDGAYAYGWVVPALAIFLFKSRWDDRPAPEAPLRTAAVVAVLLALVALPAHWLQEAAPERGICAWTYAIAVVGTSLALVATAGGAAWLRWFVIPVAFLLTAVPWPHGIEILVSDSLMRRTASATVEVLCLTGVPAAQSGNLVHVETGVIDIDEACSGIRSIQAMVMISLFLGELFRLKPMRRVLLIVFGLVVTVLANVLRTVMLSRIGFAHGMGAVDRIHDAAGFAVLVFCLASTGIAAFLMHSARHSTQDSQPAPGVGRPMFPLALSVAVLVWFPLAQLSVEAWYRLHEPQWRGWSWSVQWPGRSAGFHFVDIPPRSRRLLMCDESHAANWMEPDGSDWSLYWIRWKPGNIAAEAAKVHRPDVCLAAEGAIVEKDMGTHVSPVGGTQIPFHSYIFRMGDKTLFVFYCLCEEGPGGIAWNPQFEQTGMLERALEGRRRIGQQSMEFDISGYPSEAVAERAFAARLAGLIRTAD